MGEYEFHPAANLFPMMTDAELEALGGDMLQNAQREEIILYKGQILDGRNRYRACLLKGINPRFREERTPDPYAFVASANLHRRHLDASQRAMIAANLATLRDGQNKAAGASPDAPTQTDAAKLLEVSRPSVQRARYVKEHGVPDLVDAVKGGDVKVKPAAEFAKAVPPLDQQRLIGEHGSAAAAVKAVQAKADRAAQVMPRKVPDPKPAADRAEARARLDAARATYVATVEAAHLTMTQRTDEIRQVVRRLYVEGLPGLRLLLRSIAAS
ncbi:hypothetical protein [Bradyrhizobium sp. Ash2021]|uniref:hypothetical protein n=1 Tax=Bradyrhizobium sp. Ash2021 TaxID=2954771 RepID=UPI0028156FAE|nr:hypothetical protein [Bradyrhizobium sp. Ash2021]WMT70970.1 hypothetical protein NL528_22925 [Bradyrhizobium sp. Ash2021]